MTVPLKPVDRMDHHGGLPAFLESLTLRGIELVLHPAAFRSARYIKLSEERRIPLPAPDRNRIEKAGVRVVPARTLHLLLGGALLFLGEIPRRTEFEKGMPKARYEEGGAEKFDPIEDDSAVVAHVMGAASCRDGMRPTFADVVCENAALRAAAGGYRLGFSNSFSRTSSAWSIKPISAWVPMWPRRNTLPAMGP